MLGRTSEYEHLRELASLVHGREKLIRDHEYTEERERAERYRGVYTSLQGRRAPRRCLRAGLEAREGR
jgi:hypothetical protein